MGNLPKSFTPPTGVPIELEQAGWLAGRQEEHVFLGTCVLFLVESLIKFLINEISGLHMSFGKRDHFLSNIYVPGHDKL